MIPCSLLQRFNVPGFNVPGFNVSPCPIRDPLRCRQISVLLS
jgi:hypothetical protein